MKYNSIIFDLDGTLLDTLEDLTDSINFMLDAYQFPRKTSEQICAGVGNGIVRLVERSLPDGLSSEQIQDAFQVFTNHYSENCYNKTKPYDGIMEVLEVLKKNNMKLAIVSNKADTAVQTLNNIFFHEYISVAIGERPGLLRKPAPDLVLLALERLNSTKKETLYVGDSEVDIETARNAGIQCLSVSWGFRDALTLQNSGADTMIDEPNKILQYTNTETNSETNSEINSEINS